MSENVDSPQVCPKLPKPTDDIRKSTNPVIAIDRQHTIALQQLESILRALMFEFMAGGGNFLT